MNLFLTYERYCGVRKFKDISKFAVTCIPLNADAPM